MEYTLDAGNFNKSFDGDLIYFDDGSVGIEDQGLEEVEIMRCPVRLTSGAYDIKILYVSESRTDITNINNCAGKIVFNVDNFQILKASEIQLRDGLNEMQSRFWLRSCSGENEVRLCVRYYGNGKLSIKNILIEEKREYRLMRFLSIFILMAVCNLFYVFFIRDNHEKLMERKKFIIVGIIGITLFSSITYFTDFLFMGHDLYFHLSRIISLAKGLKEFQIPHRMQFGMLSGYGYATPLYYGEIFLILPAILYNFYVPIQTCYQIYVVIVNFMTSLISYWCFSRISQDWKKGLVGALVYTLAAYRLTDVMIRSAVGEYTALVFLPLLLYGFWSIYNKSENEKITLENYLPIIIAATGVINSHILSCEMILLFLVPFMIINYKKTFRRNIFLALIKSSLLSLLLNLWFIIPFMQSMKMGVNIADSDAVSKIECNSVYIPQLLGIFHTAVGWNVGDGAKNEMPLAIGFSFVIGICLFVFVFIKKDAWGLSHKEMRPANYCFIFGLTALFLASDLYKSDNLIYVNRQIARLAGIIQFPWRYLGIAAVCLTTMLILAMQIAEKHITVNQYNGIILIIVAAVVLPEGHFMMEFVNVQDEKRVYSEADIGTMVIIGGEYLLQGTDISECEQNRSLNTGRGYNGSKNLL